MGHVAGSELTPGTTVAGYRIELLVGRGGMGAVYRAEEVGLGRKVALKVIAPELAQEERFRDRFLRESRIAASLDHPHVIPIYQAGEDQGLLFLAMRYVEGTDLAKLVADEGALEPRRALELLSQVAEALDAAHALGLVHRDVKPSNVLIAQPTGREHCYLADFGLTKRTGSFSGVSAAGEIVGTLEYVAPEQITGASLNERTDVYSLGCVLHECLTGQTPFPRATDVALLWAHVHEEPARPSQARPGLPNALDEVLARALAKEPSRRYDSAGELVAASREAIGIGEPRRRVRKASSRAALVGGRRRALAALATVVALVAAAGVAAVLLTRGDAAPLIAPPDSVAVIDPSSNRVIEAIPVGGQVGAIAAGAGAVWVANVDDRTLTRLDPRTRAVERRITLEGTPTGVAAGPTGVWVAHGLVGSVARVDPELDEVVETTQDAVGRSGSAAIALSEGAVWVVSRNGELARIDARSGSVSEPQVVGAVTTAIAFGEGLVWVANATASTISVVNPRTLSTVATVSAGADPSGVAVGEGAVWVTNHEDGTVTRIHPRSFAAHTIEVGRGPTGIATGAGAVWVANRDEGTVSRIDPKTREVSATIAVGNRPDGIVVSDGVVWVTVQAP